MSPVDSHIWPFSPRLVVIGEVMEFLGGGAWQQKVCHQRWLPGWIGSPYFLVHSLCLGFGLFDFLLFCLRFCCCCWKNVNSASPCLSSAAMTCLCNDESKAKINSFFCKLSLVLMLHHKQKKKKVTIKVYIHNTILGANEKL